MKRHMYASQIALFLLCAVFSAAEARADVKIKTRQTSNGQSSEGATYIKGKRQRTESGGGQMITIQECDLRRDIQIMPQVKAYVVRPYDDASAVVPASANAPQQGPVTKGGLVTSTVTSRDTGERKQMFGYIARHIITSIVTTSSPDACSPNNSKMETDGWYIDAAFALDCDSARAGVYMNRQQAPSGCRDRYQTKQIGAAKRGFAVWEKMTMFGDDGSVSFTMVNEVVEFSQATLDAALFEAPAGYREVKDFAEAYASAAAADDSDNNANAGSATNTQTQQTASAVDAKKAGVIRLGLVSVTTGSVADNIRAADLGAAVENTLAARLRSQSVEIVRINATMPSQIEAEAKQKECDYVVYANVSHKKGGGGFGGMLGKVSTAVTMAAGGDASGGEGASATPRENVTAASASAGVKSKDELTLDLRVQTPASASPVAARQCKSKAKSAGEDIISPVVEQAAQVILAAASIK